MTMNLKLLLGMKHRVMELFKVYINHDPEMTLTYFTARSTSRPILRQGQLRSPVHLNGEKMVKCDILG